jgi:hypothetical protein
MALKAGDWVEVRSKSEILRTLDNDARLDGMPFMPEMLQYCGQRFQVKSRAHKTCDPIYTYSSRRIADAVHLSLRCDGKAHGGCQTACLLFWKEYWLKPVSPPAAGAGDRPQPTPAPDLPSAHGGCTEERVYAAAQVGGGSGDASGDIQYACQTTQLCEFSEQLSCWDMRQYAEDYTSGNVTLGALARGGFYVLLGRRFEQTHPYLRRFYNFVQALTGGRPSPARKGALPNGEAFPLAPLDLQPGDLVRVKSHGEILKTIRADNFHRGLYFDVDMVPYCGGIYRVKRRMERFLDEKTGRMRALKTPAVILDNVWCTGQYSTCRMFCPRALHSWWREEWLERVNEEAIGRDGRAEIARAPRREEANAAS